MSAPQLTFLGTGTSVGVPVIGCDCAVCVSPDPRNVRTRSSVVLEGPHGTLLVDSGPDLRMQALRENLRRVDAVLYTHAHLDHVTGFDELRAFCWHREEALPLYANPGCLGSLREMFGWAFSGQNTYRGYIKPAPRTVLGPFEIGGFRVTPLPVRHGSVETNGYRFEAAGMRSLAYIPDVKEIPPATLALLEGVEIMVVDALRPQAHETHFTISEACEAVTRVGAGEAWLTHLGHENDHEDLEKSLPAGVRVAWDGLKLDLAAG